MLTYGLVHQYSVRYFGFVIGNKLETEIIALDFANKSHVAIYTTAEISSIPYYQCQLIYTNKIGKVAVITAFSFFIDETADILDLFYSVDRIDDMFKQESSSDEKDAASTDTETGKNIYETSALSATVSLPGIR